MIKGIIFDFDGLICDTETLELEIWHEVFQSNGYNFPHKKYLKTIGSVDTRNNLENIFQDLDIPIDRKEKIQAQMVAKYREKVNQQPLQPGVMDFFEEAKEIGLKIGLASSSGKEFIMHHLGRLNIGHFFDCIYTRDDVKNVKPDPELFIRALDCLGLSPGEAITLEDSINGVEAARHAGIYTVAVPNPVTSVFNFDRANLKIDALENTSIKTLIRQIE